MSDRPLKNRIIDWLKTLDYWFQYASNKLLENEPLSDDLISMTYALFKEEYGLEEEFYGQAEIEYNEITESEEVDETIQLKEIKHIENVNALAPEQTISVHPNLTLIYGHNGTGKSGYIRLLNNAFRSRGDKEILPNVFEDKDFGDPTCKFLFVTEEGEHELEYPQDKNNIEFTRFSVFDSHSVKVHLEEDNKLNFTPKGFEFFDKALILYHALTSRLKGEIQLNRSENDYEKHFVNENAIQTEIKNLGPTTDENKLKELGNYTKEDAQKLDELLKKWKDLKALDIPKKILELQKLLELLKDFISKEQAILDELKKEKIEGYALLIANYTNLVELTKQEGVDGLKEYDIESISSNEWKTFIKASKSYADVIESGRGISYPKVEDNCLFCLQPIGKKENELINAYWKLLKSESEAELQKIFQKIQEALKHLKSFNTVSFDENTLIYDYTKANDEEFADKWKFLVAHSASAIKNLITNLSELKWANSVQFFTESTKEFDSIQKTISEKIEALIKKNPKEELKKLEAEINYLKDKHLLSKLLSNILVFVRADKWAARAEKHLSIFNTRSITTKQGELFNETITEKYTDTFNKECEQLDAPKIVNIIQKNVKASTLRKLKIAGQDANTVLSEGEQRAISLADFLTEFQLDPNNRGIFFDDPVSSQDHHRREKIASRLVELAKYKQIVILTHDIAFFIRMKILAETTDLNYQYTTIRKAGDISGVINPDLPWIAQPVKRRIGTLKDRLVRLKKIEKEGDEDEYLFAAKSWYGLLREAWERGVEERLFKGVVERFSIGVQTLRLKKIVVTPELIAEIEHGMTESSNWLHDAAAGLNPQPPDTNKAEADLNDFEEFAKKCVAA